MYSVYCTLHGSQSRGCISPRITIKFSLNYWAIDKMDALYLLAQYSFNSSDSTQSKLWQITNHFKATFSDNFPSYLSMICLEVAWIVMNSPLELEISVKNLKHLLTPLAARRTCVQLLLYLEMVERIAAYCHMLTTLLYFDCNSYRIRFTWCDSTLLAQKVNK